MALMFRGRLHSVSGHSNCELISQSALQEYQYVAGMQSITVKLTKQ
jgi:hypothetical protein